MHISGVRICTDVLLKPAIFRDIIDNPWFVKFVKILVGITSGNKDLSLPEWPLGGKHKGISCLDVPDICPERNKIVRAGELTHKTVLGFQDFGVTQIKEFRVLRNTMLLLP